MGAQEVPKTPSEQDIPKAKPLQMDLAGSERPDIVRFLHVRRAYAPSLSPDGSRLAFRTTITGEPQLWAVDASGGWPHQLTFGESVTFHEWSPAGDWIIYGSDRGGNEREGFYLIDPEGTTERELLAPSEAFRVYGGFSPDGGRIVYSTTERNGLDFDVHVIDVASGEDRKVFQGRMGLYAVSWSPDASAVLLTESRGEAANDVYLLDLESGRLDTLFLPEDPAAYGDFSWVPDGSGFYLTTNQGREFSGLAYYDLGRAELEHLETPDHDVEGASLSRDGRLLAWTTNVGGYSVLRVRDLERGEEIWTRSEELPRGIYALEWANAAPVAAIYVTGPQIPGDIWTWDAWAGSLYRATESSMAGIDASGLALPEHLSFQARDGETLHGLLYLPEDARRPPPVLLAVHGGPTSQARPDFDPVTQYLLTRGIAIFDLNYRGSTGYGKRFTRLDNRRLRPNQLYDMEDAVNWLGEEGLVDASRAAVMGGSYGGYMTLAALTQLPHRFRGGVSLVGVSNWVSALEGASPQLKASDRIEYGDIDDPEDREFFREISPITHVANVQAPVMVIHGANDPRDPVSESDQFVQAVRERGGEVEYLRFPDEGHGIRKLENRIIAYRRVAEFLQRILSVGGVRSSRDSMEHLGL